MELATRRGSKEFVAGLSKCIDKDCAVSASTKTEWQRLKDLASRLFDPDKGGRYEIFNDRPLKPEIMQYCAQDVVLLPRLYDVYITRLRLPGELFWAVEVQKATKDRIKLSQSPTYDGQATDKVRGPWDEGYIEQALEQWNDDIMFDAMNGDDEFNEEDDFDDYQDTARDCIGWEEDMEKNGEPF